MRKLLLFIPIIALATSCKFNENGNKMVLPADPNAIDNHTIVEEIHHENKVEQDNIQILAPADSLGIDSTAIQPTEVVAE
ncbi:Uncharacterised protein [Candidatus Ornithobacterium hominis]|uniref:Uncharacterized protein n=2 Tax=Candidatus Ornithobacterium hominis TaxID=2497989 RepID=A0A383TZ44_9FLAO|nr:Uncharacterised protein [Candidatus Ornithobacterium hominis]